MSSDRKTATQVAPLWRCVRTFTISSTPRFLISRVGSPAALIAAVVLLRRRPLALLFAVVATLAAALAGLKLVRAPNGVRREGVTPGAGEQLANLDLTYRNPRWAAVRGGDAVRVEEFTPADCVDGTAQLLKSPDAVVGSFAVTPLPAALDVWFTPFAAYHVDELGPVMAELSARGVRAAFVFEAMPSDAVLTAVGRFSSTCHVANFQSDQLPSAVVTMIDWGLAAQLVDRARATGVKVISKVEGAQDFHNEDAPMRVIPYSRSTLVLAQGAYDVANIRASQIAEVGSARLEGLLRLRRAGLVERATQPPLLNLNFSYGVLGAWSRPWFEIAKRGFTSAGVEFRTSLHPAQSAPNYVRNRSTWPLALDIETSSHLVSRRSAAMFDALILGRPVVYLNPHRERSWRGVEWGGAVFEARTPAGLARALATLDPDDERQADVRRAQFLRMFLSVDPNRPAHLRMADCIAAHL